MLNKIALVFLSLLVSLGAANGQETKISTDDGYSSEPLFKKLVRTGLFRELLERAKADDVLVLGRIISRTTLGEGVNGKDWFLLKIDFDRYDCYKCPEDNLFEGVVYTDDDSTPREGELWIVFANVQAVPEPIRLVGTGLPAKIFVWDKASRSVEEMGHEILDSLFLLTGWDKVETK